MKQSNNKYINIKPNFKPSQLSKAEDFQVNQNENLNVDNNFLKSSPKSSFFSKESILFPGNIYFEILKF